VKKLQQDIHKRIEINENTREFLDEPLQHFGVIESDIKRNLAQKPRKLKSLKNAPQL
jgi:hypothetical protein